VEQDEYIDAYADARSSLQDSQRPASARRACPGQQHRRHRVKGGALDNTGPTFWRKTRHQRLV